jgi:hypothetical protein
LDVASGGIGAAPIGSLSQDDLIRIMVSRHCKSAEGRKILVSEIKD